MAQTVLEQTKGQYNLVGKIKGLGNENALREGVTKADKPYKSLSFFVETSPTNAIRVEIFAMEWDEVTAYNSKDKSKKKVPWSERFKDHSPYKVMGTGFGIEKDEKGKNIRKSLQDWDAVDYILENLKDGDSVFVAGQVEWSKYKNQQDEIVEQVRYTLQNLSLTKDPVDFEAEDFKEVARFEQEVVISDVLVDSENKKLVVSAKVINYKGEHEDATFVVDAEKYPKLANNMHKRFKFGDFIKVFGLCINAVELEEVEEDDDDDDWGGDDEIKKDFNRNYVRNYVQELQITSVDSSTYEPKKYNEEDFFNEDEDTYGDEEEEFDIEEGDDFGDDDEFEDDDLPF